MITFLLWCNPFRCDLNTFVILFSTVTDLPWSLRDFSWEYSRLLHNKACLLCASTQNGEQRGRMTDLKLNWTHAGSLQMHLNSKRGQPSFHNICRGPNTLWPQAYAMLMMILSESSRLSCRLERIMNFMTDTHRSLTYDVGAKTSGAAGPDYDLVWTLLYTVYFLLYLTTLHCLFPHVKASAPNFHSILWKWIVHHLFKLCNRSHRSALCFLCVHFPVHSLSVHLLMRLKPHCKYQETETLRFKINDPLQIPPSLFALYRHDAKGWQF